MRNAYYSILWGLLLVVLDFRFGTFDVLPDVLGYVLIIIGLSTLKTIDRHFTISWWAAAAMIVISIVTFFQPVSSLEMSTAVQSISVVQIGWAFLLIILDIVMIYGICKGIIGHATLYNNQDLVQFAKRSLNTYVTLSVISLIALPFYLDLPQGLTMIIFITLWLMLFIAMIFIIRLLYRSGRELE
ncbi:hypothetical protein PASE110613_14630 [Paenibacillus sediminis]|uniref:DUF308 domain-containing protein n=1 Tax=Paenibacillus sediminis TaxID=664909 RepID=A0ABS4H6Q9_9BACL|nr:hypothetical protein [Paenibacillus sediminis]MBP1938052.1 hypothetical protein [Paenibacillus sediminis]